MQISYLLNGVTAAVTGPAKKVSYARTADVGPVPLIIYGLAGDTVI